MGYRIAVDLYNGVMNSGELNKTASNAAANKMIRMLFLYSAKSLHKCLELNAVSLLLSSIPLIFFEIRCQKYKKTMNRQQKKGFVHLFSAGITSDRICFRLNSLVKKIRLTLTANAIMKE